MANARLLFPKPGELTREYLAGRRRRYVLPLRLYLTISLVALVALRVARGAAVSSVRARDRRSNSSPATQPRRSRPRPRARAGLRDGVFFCEDLPAWLCRRLQRRLDLDPKVVSREFEQASRALPRPLGQRRCSCSCRCSRCGCKLAYLNRRLRYTEHLVFALHLHAFWFAAIALMQLPLPVLEARSPLLAIPVYALLATQRVYGGRWWADAAAQRGRRTCLRRVTLAVALGIVALWALLG